MSIKQHLAYFNSFAIKWVAQQYFQCLSQRFQSGHRVRILIHECNDSERNAFTCVDFKISIQKSKTSLVHGEGRLVVRAPNLGIIPHIYCSAVRNLDLFCKHRLYQQIKMLSLTPANFYPSLSCPPLHQNPCSCLLKFTCMFPNIGNAEKTKKGI